MHTKGQSRDSRESQDKRKMRQIYFLGEYIILILFFFSLFIVAKLYCSQSKRDGSSKSKDACGQGDGTGELNGSSRSREVGGRASALEAVSSDVVILTIASHKCVRGSVFWLIPHCRGIVSLGVQVSSCR